jgi:hypothetical protein
MIDDSVSETRALIQRLRDDAQQTHQQAEYYERDADRLRERAARKRQQANVWSGAAQRLETMLVNNELQEPLGLKEGEDNVPTNTIADD